MSAGLSKPYIFSEAVPVWEKGKEREMNYSLVFRAVISGGENTVLALAAHYRYQIFINGVFFAAGPARCARGFYRVSEYSLYGRLSDGKNIIAVLVSGCSINSFCSVDEPAFLCAQASRGGEVLFATGKKDIEAAAYTERIRRVPRYSFQRPFTESYSLGISCDAFFTRADFSAKTVALCETGQKSFIDRNAPYCEYRKIRAKNILSTGKLLPCREKRRFTDRSLTQISEKLRGFSEKSLEECPVNEVYACDMQPSDNTPREMRSVKIDAGAFCVYDMGKNYAGFISLDIRTEADTAVYAVFNEILPENGIPDPGRDGCENVVKWRLSGGRSYTLTSFEPYTFRYIQLISMNSPVYAADVRLLEEAYPESGLTGIKKMPDAELQKIYDAAVLTFRENATDIFTDCPSRERAGWLCDSFFTARTEKELTGKSDIEHDFLENFLLPESFPHLPGGIIPMCYPADHDDGVFIHNWALWYILELREYYLRTGDRELVEKAKKKIYALLDFSKKYENGDGLLADVDSWIFVEWSRANDFVKDISYPSNMLYARALECAGELYSDTALLQKAENLRKTVIEQSFDGKFFCDNAVYDENKKAVRTENHTETCQYYAFFTKTASKQDFPELYKTLIEDFGPQRKQNGSYPDVPFANAFVGVYMRLEILFRAGLYDRLRDEIRDFFLPMAEKTGTLWENMTDHASCCHGFASHAAVWLSRICENIGN